MAEHQLHVGIVWLYNPTIGLNKERPGDYGLFYPLDVNHARPASLHPNGFMVAFADGSTKYVSDILDYTVYARLMTSNGRRARVTLTIPMSPRTLSGKLFLLRTAITNA